MPQIVNTDLYSWTSMKSLAYGKTLPLFSFIIEVCIILDFSEAGCGGKCLYSLYLGGGGRGVRS